MKSASSLANDDLEKVRLGNTGLTVTPIGFGAASLGDMPKTYGYRVDAARAAATINAIFEGPVNFLDVSRGFWSGRSEERIGAVIRERGLPAGFVISTKIDREAASGSFDAARTRRSIEASLAALGLARIDLLFINEPPPSRTLDEARTSALGELFRLKEEGLAKALGLAVGNVDVAFPLLQDWSFDALMTHNRFTLVNRNAEALIDYAAKRGVAVINAAPYAGGVLAKGASAFRRYVYQEAAEAALAPVRRIEEVCVRNGVPPGAAALQYSLRDKRIAMTVCGISRPERVAETLAWARFPIADAVWKELAALPFATDDPEATRAFLSA